LRSIARAPKEKEELQQNKSWKDRVCSLEQIDREIFGKNFL